MFSFFKDKQLLEQKKMLWQNLFGAKDIIEILEKRREHYVVMGKQYEELNERLLEKLDQIYSIASTIINSGDHKQKLDKERLNYIWQDNKALRGIYAEHLQAQNSRMSFDSFINPAYGWDVALKDWN